MDNRGAWFLCRSHWTVAQLERRFAQELVSSHLFEHIGGMLQGDKPYLYLQIALSTMVLQRLHPDSDPEWVEVPILDKTPDWNIVQSLKDVEISVVSLVPDIRNVIESGRY